MFFLSLAMLHQFSTGPSLQTDAEVYLGSYRYCACSVIYLKDSDFIGIFYCFSNFGTILIIIIKRFRFYRNLLLFFEFRYYPYYY